VNWAEHKKRWKDCDGCFLCETRKNVVLLRGKIPADVLFLGEAPGASEDVLGQPFIGPAGKLLDSIVQEAMEQSKTVRVAFTNLVACIPIGDEGSKTQEPSKESIKACADRLKEAVHLVKPKGIVCVGKLAKKHVIGQADFSYRKDYGLSWIPSHDFLRFTEIVHPAAILRSEVSQTIMVQRCVATLAEFFSTEIEACPF